MNVVELRRYVLKPGRRDELIDLFEREFIETQEACGMLPVAHGRDLDDPDRFIWLREFADMPARLAALNAFYLDSSVWKENPRCGQRDARRYGRRPLVAARAREQWIRSAWPYASAAPAISGGHVVCCDNGAHARRACG